MFSILQKNRRINPLWENNFFFLTKNNICYYKKQLLLSTKVRKEEQNSFTSRNWKEKTDKFSQDPNKQRVVLTHKMIKKKINIFNFQPPIDGKFYFIHELRNKFSFIVIEHIIPFCPQHSNTTKPNLLQKWSLSLWENKFDYYFIQK